MSQFKKILGIKQIKATDKAEPIKQNTDKLLVTPQTESLVPWMNRIMEGGKKMSQDENYRKKIAKRHL